MAGLLMEVDVFGGSNGYFCIRFQVQYLLGVYSAERNSHYVRQPTLRHVSMATRSIHAPFHRSLFPGNTSPICLILYCSGTIHYS